MTNLIFLIIGIILGMGVSAFARSYGGTNGVGEIKNKKGLIKKQAEEKKRNIEAIMGLMESGNQPLTNSQVEQMLGIPESTVTRYFDELEKAGKVRQVGKTGQEVFYERV